MRTCAVTIVALLDISKYKPQNVFDGGPEDGDPHLCGSVEKQHAHAG